MLKIITIAFFIFWGVLGIYFVIKESLESNEDRIQAKKERAGSTWETRIAQDIDKYLNVPVFRNVLIPTKTQYATTECDIVFVNKKGVFCVECKHRSGVDVAFFKVDDEYIESFDKAGHPINNDYKYLNPIIQNKNHIKWLKESLPKKNIPVYNVICTNYDIKLNYMGITRIGNEFGAIDMLRTEEGLFIGSIRFLKDALMQMPDVLAPDDVLLLEHAISFYSATEDEMIAFKNSKKS